MQINLKDTESDIVHRQNEPAIRVGDTIRYSERSEVSTHAQGRQHD